LQSLHLVFDSKSLKNSPEEKHHESTCHTRNDDYGSRVLGGRAISKQFHCSTKVAQRATRRHLDARLVGSGSPGWQQIETVWGQSEGYQRLRHERSFFCHGGKRRQFANR